MLDMAFGSIRFPRLIHQGEDYRLKANWPQLSNPHQPNEIPSGYEKKKVHLYSLDWGSFDDRKREKFWDWVKKHHPKNGDLQYVPSLPEKYTQAIDDLVFCLDTRYLDEIHRCSRMAFMEWSQQRHFDTSVRDMCLEPAKAYVTVAFRLICDCPFDRAAHRFREHDWVRRIASHAMLYRFWDGQTGGGLLWDNAEMEKLNPENWPAVWKPMDPEVAQFYADMKLHEEEKFEKSNVALEI